MEGPHGIIVGVAIWFIVRMGVLALVPRDHRHGLDHTKHAEFSAAINCFERSLDFFTRYPWLDRYRAIFLLSASNWSYREMAMANIAFCHGQLGNGEASRSWYERTLVEFPESVLARTALNMINASTLVVQQVHRQPEEPGS